MVRAGEGGYLASEVVEKGCVALGFDGVGDFSTLETLDALKGALRKTYPAQSKVQNASAAGVAHRFRTVIKRGDHVVTYDPATRLYHVGVTVGDYEYAPGHVTDYAHIRRVRWEREVSRDVLSPDVRNSLGSTISLFELGEHVFGEFERVATRTSGSSDTSPAEPLTEYTESERIYRDQLSRSHEFIKDRISRLDPRDMENLAAAPLRALGLRARVTAVGPDRGRDVLASPDGLGLQSLVSSAK